MEFPGECLDDVLMDLYKELLASGSKNTSGKGDSLEHLGVILRITKPRARLSRSWTRGRPLFSALGELVWYLAGSDDAAFIGRYIPDYVRPGMPAIVHGAYGPRIKSRYGLDQLATVTELLGERDGSRRVIIQLYEARDLEVPKEDVPCTTALQFFRRQNVLHMSATMRSNDAYIGLPHDVFCFTMIQELVAAELGLELGEYIHMVGSMHLYTDKLELAERYISEGYHRTSEMPAMPLWNSFAMMDRLIELESRIRAGETVDPGAELDCPYWSDLVRLIQTHFASDDLGKIDEILDEMNHNFFHTFIVDRRGRRVPAGPDQTASA